MIYIYHFIFLLKRYYKKNDLNTVKIIFCNVIGCSIGVYNFLLPRLVLKYSTPNETSGNKMPSYFRVPNKRPSSYFFLPLPPPIHHLLAY